MNNTTRHLPNGYINYKSQGRYRLGVKVIPDHAFACACMPLQTSLWLRSYLALYDTQEEEYVWEDYVVYYILHSTGEVEFLLPPSEQRHAPAMLDEEHLEENGECVQFNDDDILAELSAEFALNPEMNNFKRMKSVFWRNNRDEKDTLPLRDKRGRQLGALVVEHWFTFFLGYGPSNLRNRCPLPEGFVINKSQQNKERL